MRNVVPNNCRDVQTSPLAPQPYPHPLSALTQPSSHSYPLPRSPSSIASAELAPHPAPLPHAPETPAETRVPALPADSAAQLCVSPNSPRPGKVTTANYPFKPSRHGPSSPEARRNLLVIGYILSPRPHLPSPFRRVTSSPLAHSTEIATSSRPGLAARTPPARPRRLPALPPPRARPPSLPPITLGAPAPPRPSGHLCGPRGTRPPHCPPLPAPAPLPQGGRPARERGREGRPCRLPALCPGPRRRKSGLAAPLAPGFTCGLRTPGRRLHIGERSRELTPLGRRRRRRRLPPRLPPPASACRPALPPRPPGPAPRAPACVARARPRHAARARPPARQPLSPPGPASRRGGVAIVRRGAPAPWWPPGPPQPRGAAGGWGPGAPVAPEGPPPPGAACGERAESTVHGTAPGPPLQRCSSPGLAASPAPAGPRLSAVQGRPGPDPLLLPSPRLADYHPPLLSRRRATIPRPFRCGATHASADPAPF